MGKKVIVLAIVAIFIFSVSAVYAENYTPPTEKTKDRINSGMNDLLYGPTEIPKNLDQTKSKGTKIEGAWNQRTRTGLERGIARVCTGVWKLATFWYSDPGCATTAPAKQQTKTK